MYKNYVYFLIDELRVIDELFFLIVKLFMNVVYKFIYMIKVNVYYIVFIL